MRFRRLSSGIYGGLLVVYQQQEIFQSCFWILRVFQGGGFFRPGLEKHIGFGNVDLMRFVKTLGIIAAIFFVAARTFLVVEAFVSFRSLTAGSYQVVQWLNMFSTTKEVVSQ